jgi:hypothetical protein
MQLAAPTFVEWLAYDREALAFERMLIPLVIRPWQRDLPHDDVLSLAKLRRRQAECLLPVAMSELKAMAGTAWGCRWVAEQLAP